jgi:MFS family permease
MRSRQALYLYLIFFSAGFAILANAQRFPELQHQLNIGNGAFGTYLGLAAIGSFIAFIYGSRIIHLFGIAKTLFFAPTGLYLSTGTIPHIHSSAIFILINIIFGFFATLNHISINAQGIHSEKKLGKLLLPFLAGVWSLGALFTSLLATFIAKEVSLVGM